MKNLRNIIVFILIFGGIIGIFFGVIQKKETDLFNEISIEEYNEKVADKKDFILYIHSPTCSHCLDFKPKLNKIIKKKHVTVFGMDMSKEENRADNLVKDGTPVLIIFKGGEEVNRQIGDKTEKETLEFLKDEIK